jgi:hypothetical protein
MRSRLHNFTNVIITHRDEIRYFSPQSNLSNRINEFNILERSWLYSLSNDASFIALF